MNKTVNINIGGLFFHTDEDAYQKLTHYFDAVKRSLSNSSSKDEIMKDIEMRVAELLNEKQLTEKHVVNTKDVDEVITIMGKPEDYRIDEDGQENNDINFGHKKNRKLYRDRENGSIGGVLSGLGYYFGIDRMWLRIAFLCLVLFAGTGILAYIILWIVMPEAKTTSEKLEMTGEPINISNIEKKVREEFENISDKIKNADYDKFGNQIKNSGGAFGDVIINIIKALGKIFGAFIIFVSGICLIGIFIASIIMFFSSSLSQSFLNEHVISTPLGIETPLWIQGILLLFVFGIPFFFLTILGLKILINNLKSIGNPAKYSLLAIWIISLLIVIYLGVNKGMEYASEGKTYQKEIINIKSTDTLFVKFKTNDFYAKNIDDTTDFKITTNEAGREILYSNEVSIEILKTDEILPYVKIEKTADGKTSAEAKLRAEKIQYGFKIVGNQLIFDNYFLTEIKSKIRNQEVQIFLYLPKGTILKPDSSMQEYDESDNDFFNLHYSGNYIYKVGDNKVKCLNCPSDENEYKDVTFDENYDEDIDKFIDSAGSLEIDKDGIVIKKAKDKSDKNNEDIKSIKIDKDGISIKTK